MPLTTMELLTRALNLAVKDKQDELWSRQLEVYPKSVRLTPQQVIEWAFQPSLPGRNVTALDHQLRRFRAIAMALQYPVHVWYTLPKYGSVAGCRFGFEASEYLSNFSDL